MGFDDANHQEPPGKAEYEAWEKEEKRKLSECCCCEGDFRFCHGEVTRLNLQVGEYRDVVHGIKAEVERLFPLTYLVEASTDQLAAWLWKTTKKALEKGQTEKPERGSPKPYTGYPNEGADMEKRVDGSLKPAGNWCRCVESFNRNGVCTRCGYPVH